MSKSGFPWNSLARLLTKAHSWTGQQTFSNINITGGSITGAVTTLPMATSTNPGVSAATTVTIVDANSGVIILQNDGSPAAQTIGSPTVVTAGKIFTVVNNDTSVDNVVVNGFTVTPGEAQSFIWDGSAWGPTDLGITKIPVLTTQGGTGRATGTTSYALVATGTTATGAQQTLAKAGAATEILVGGGASALPVWGTDIPTAVTIGTKYIYRADGTDIAITDGGTGASTAATAFANIKQAATTSTSGVTVYSGSTKALAGTDTASAMTPADVAAAQAVVSNPKAMSQGVAMTAATTGSTGIQVAHSAVYANTTNSFGFAFNLLLPSYTVAAVLKNKFSGSSGVKLEQVVTSGIYRLTINTKTYDSTVPGGGAASNLVAGTKHHLAVIVTVVATTTVSFYLDGVLLNTTAAQANETISNSDILYLMGTSSTRTAGTITNFVMLNRSYTAAEVLDLYRNGIAYADRWGSQTVLSTGNWLNTFATSFSTFASTGPDNFTASDAAGKTGVRVRVLAPVGFGKKARVTYKCEAISGVTSISLGMSNDVTGYSGGYGTFSSEMPVAGNTYTYETIVLTEDAASVMFSISVNAGGSFQISNFSCIEIGATLALESEGMQPAPGQCLDSSSNKMHAMLPAAGASLTRSKKDFEYRWTNTWTASSAAQYVGGLNQAVLSADHFITDIITQATVTTDVKNLELGDGSDADRFVAAFAPSATRTKQTIAAQNDGTNRKLVYTPAAEATMTVETIIRGFIWEP